MDQHRQRGVASPCSLSHTDVERCGPFIEPQLLTSVDQPPQGGEWLHEIKHDGYRTLLVVEGKQARAYTRTGLDWTSRYPGIVSAVAKLNCRSAILDGEAIVQDERGASDFDALMSAIRWNPHKLIFYAFDLLHLDGKDRVIVHCLSGARS